jgi:DNA adenine methylase
MRSPSRSTWKTFPAALPPLFRWPGGKRWPTNQLLDAARQSEGRYFEPFFGGGALFFALHPSRATISDTNPELMLCYETVRDHSDELAALLCDMQQDEASYYLVRASRPVDKLGRAARFLHLATLAFNGIHRVNRKGEFNVPYGHRDYEGLGDSANLRLYSDALEG